MTEKIAYRVTPEGESKPICKHDVTGSAAVGSIFCVEHCTSYIGEHDGVIICDKKAELKFPTRHFPIAWRVQR